MGMLAVWSGVDGHQIIWFYQQNGLSILFKASYLVTKVFDWRT